MSTSVATTYASVFTSEPRLSRRQLLAVLEDRAEIVNMVSNRPYTYVRIRTWYNNHEYYADGFSKVMWPDRWDYEQGVEIAQRHALINTLHQIRAAERREDEAFEEIPF